MLKEVAILIKKDIQIEWRQKYALSSLLLYVIGAVLICYMGFYQNLADLRPLAWNSTLWIMLLFIGIQSVSKSFQQEPSSRHFYYYYLCSPTSIILSKTIYNTLLMVFVGFLTIAIFYFIMPPAESMGSTGFFIKNQGVYFSNLIIGCSLFGSGLTLISAIASKVNNSGALMAILSFPLILPIIAILIRNSINALNGLNPTAIELDLMILGLVNIMLIGISLVLFPYLWRS